MDRDTPISMPADDELIAHLKKDSRTKRQAEEELFTRHMYFIKEGMYKYKLAEEDAFDAYSDTILQAIDNIIKGSFEGRSSLKTYIYKIFCNKCVDLIRKKTTNKSSIHQTAPISDMLFMLADSSNIILQTLINQSDIDSLQQKLAQLGDNCRQLLALFSDGFTDREITMQTEYKTPEVVKTSRLRCLEKLRQLYNIKKG